ncbi:MAG: thioredoxin family protein [Thauera sp.]|nr:thioredoxin family protein [Thauera sp.]
MALVESTMLPLGTPAPAFRLPEPATGKLVSLDDFATSRAVLVAFICNHCPYVQLIREELARFGRDYLPRGLAVIAINANDASTHPADSPERMKDEVARFGYVFPYLHDASQDVARAYHAAYTPDFFLFDASRQLVYRGQFDDARPGNGIAPSGRDLRAAADAVLAGLPVSTRQKPGIGCNIKWKADGAPA